MTEQLGMDPALVYLVGLIALVLIGWLWLEWRWAKDELHRVTVEAEEAQAICDRAFDFAADLAEAAHKHGFDVAVPHPNQPPPRTTGPAFRRNGSHLRRVR